MSTFSGRLGETVPDFQCETTHGDFSFHDFLKKSQWTLLLSHPADFTPVCTTELSSVQTSCSSFDKLGVKLIGISCDTVDMHKEWSKDILSLQGEKKLDKLSFPLIADSKREIVVKLGMLDPREVSMEGLALPARSAYLFDREGKLRLSILYPATTGRSYAEILRACESVIITDKTGLATPVNWSQGQPCLVPVAITTQDAHVKFGEVKVEKLPSEKEYIRYVKCPTAVA